MGTYTEISNRVYGEWANQPAMPKNLRDELERVRGDEAAIEDRFYRDLEFGTGGLRGVLGAGTNRMNIFTVRRATLGWARYLLRNAAQGGASGEDSGAAQGGVADGASRDCDGALQTADGHALSIAVGYDCRRMSREFAVEVGCVMAAQGIKAYVFEHLCPTPELSFTVRTLGCAGGVMITASHNPPEYNGYKVYDEKGCQVLPNAAKEIIAEIAQIDNPFDVPVLTEEEAKANGLLQFVGGELDESYVSRVVSAVALPELSNEDRNKIQIVYTPLHGTGNLPVRRVLERSGYRNVHIVSSQELPNGEFPTVKSPNPEESAALLLAVELAKQVGADLAMGTDPDADRVGIAVRRKDGEYELLTGNQVGGLLVDFVLQRHQQQGTLPADAVVLKTIVTSDLGAKAARQAGVRVDETLTGFKYIGDRIAHYEETASGTFLFGYEESYGYLAADFVRDKDAVQICLLIAEMTASYKAKGWTLFDALEDLYGRVGYFREALISATLPGVEGVKQIGALMETLRKEGIEVPGMKLEAVEDYLASERRVVNGEVTALTLPKENVLKYMFENGSWFAVRPSGTEPKIKFYVGAQGDSEALCQDAVSVLSGIVDSILERVRG